MVVYGSIAVTLLTIPRRFMPTDHPVDVSFVDHLDFVDRVAKPEPPPPPPKVEEPPPPPAATAPPATIAPKPVPKPPPAAAAPLVRPDQKVRRLERPPPLKEFRAPREIPKDIPKEAEPSEDKGVAVYGEPDRGDAAGLEGGVAHGGVAGGAVGGAIELPDDAEAPRLAPGNAVPAYPAEARAARKSGTVVLKVIVYADGTVGDVRVVEGDEPFASAAVKAVTSWRYEPARYKGQPIAVYREIRIPFKLSG